jgi:hypothetical protein
MILLIVTTAYLVFCGFVVWRRPTLCCEGACMLCLGACVIIIPASIYTYHTLPENPAADWKIECIKSGGALITKPITYGDNHSTTTDCVRQHEAEVR